MMFTYVEKNLKYFEISLSVWRQTQQILRNCDFKEAWRIAANKLARLPTENSANFA